MLEKYDGKPLPYETPRTEFATGNLMKSPFSFKKYGKNGIEVSDIFPHMAEVIDEFCIVRSMISDIPNHGPSVLMMNTGSVRAGRPSMGSWVVYGLGTENQNLPGFIVLSAGAGGGGNTFSSAFLPAVYQGTMVPYNLSDPKKQIQYLENTRLNLPQQRTELIKQTRNLISLNQLPQNCDGQMGFANADRPDQQQSASIDYEKIVQNDLHFAFGNPHRFGSSCVEIRERAMLISRRNAS